MGRIKNLGIIAGKGKLPNIIATEAKKKGYNVILILLTPVADIESNKYYINKVERINIGKLGKLIKTLKKENITEVVMAGKVPKTLMYKTTNIIPDKRALKLLFRLSDRKDDTILNAIVEELETEGIKVLEITEFIARLAMPNGVITLKSPTKIQWKDIEFGFNIAKEIGRIDIGQTVVVKEKAIMAVEAIEGTDETIKRGGLLAGEGAVVVKVSKPQQDMRYDVPVVGIQTLKSMLQVKASVLALEAKHTILLQKEEMIKLANKENICIVGI